MADNGRKKDYNIYWTIIHPINDAKKVLNADYRGPEVGRDDIIKALKDKPDIIGIIDGVFHQQPAVSHKELLKALNSGITIVGGASMGALLVSELDDFGMIVWVKYMMLIKMVI